MTIAPNPFQILTWWAAHTSRIRLGSARRWWWRRTGTPSRPQERRRCWISTAASESSSASVPAPTSGVRRLHPGLKRTDGHRYVQEMLPAVKALWQGDYEHKGEYWSFPAATSVPKPLQKPHPPIWIAARSPDTYDFAVRHQCDILSWPLTRPMSELELYKGHMEKALADNPGKPRPIFATMRHTVVYERKEELEVPVKAAMRQFGQFENLFKNLGDVADGFPRTIDLSELENRGEYDPHMLHRNLMFGTPDEVITKLRAYERARRRPLHLLREPGPRHEGAEAVHGAVRQ